jgi:hypothetical protein
MEVIYISYDEAQKLLPFFEAAAKCAPYKEARESSRRILQELEFVRDRDYSPLKGCQIILSREKDREFLLDALAWIVYSGEGARIHIKEEDI